MKKNLRSRRRFKVEKKPFVFKRIKKRKRFDLTKNLENLERFEKSKNTKIYEEDKKEKLNKKDLKKIKSKNFIDCSSTSKNMENTNKYFELEILNCEIKNHIKINKNIFYLLIDCNEKEIGFFSSDFCRRKLTKVLLSYFEENLNLNN